MSPAARAHETGQHPSDHGLGARGYNMSPCGLASHGAGPLLSVAGFVLSAVLLTVIQEPFGVSWLLLA